MVCLVSAQNGVDVPVGLITTYWNNNWLMSNVLASCPFAAVIIARPRNSIINKYYTKSAHCGH